MNILIDKLPESVVVTGVEYPINFGFRAIILCEICIYDDRLTEEQKIANILNIFYKGHIPHETGEAIEMFLWFYKCGKSGNGESSQGSINSKRSYDFEQDASYIYAAYRSQYGIDLQDIPGETLHWWKFRAMFNCLDDNQQISKIIGYRSASLSGMSKEVKAHYKKMKSLYALKDDTKVDSKMKLAKRNQNMVEYVRKRHSKAGEK